MASPVGHALAGIAVGRLGERPEALAGRGFLLACIVLAIAADFDFLPGLLLGQPTLYHQGASHSLAVAALVGLAAAFAWTRGRGGLRRAWAVFFLAYASHLAVDWIGTDLRPPIGIPLLWPLSAETWISPLAGLPGVRHAVTGNEGPAGWLALIMSWVNLRAIGIEIAVVGPLALGAEVLRRRRQRRDPESPRGAKRFPASPL
ncbi:MAG: metal-dependent hydrolase [Deltaproteobacteria bacterium]|nr:metal-dependent hydrolase [Deltaproteobacteria bacterium]MBW2361428.1 metal-dependent hydrolase [Deltaproteobacteria bacterium]